MSRVAQQILDGAKKQASEIISKGEREAKAIEDVKRAAARKKADAITRDANEKARQVMNQALASARLSVRQSEVEKKEEILAAIFEDARASLAKVKISDVLPRNISGHLYVSKKDLPAAKKRFKGKLGEARILGGYILEKEGVIINNSFDVLLEDLKAEYSGKILKAVKG